MSGRISDCHSEGCSGFESRLLHKIIKRCNDTKEYINFKLRDGLEMVPAWSHKPNHVSSNLTPATI